MQLMRVISHRAIRTFAAKHPDAKTGLDQWYRITKRARWHSLVEVWKVFPHADLVGQRTVFNLGGNKYRLIARISYRTQQMFVLAILTHAEYGKEQWK
jgi:mRNA interferase HigB